MTMKVVVVESQLRTELALALAKIKTLEAICDDRGRALQRLREERERLVSTTELGKLSEDLEAENAAGGAATVRAAMHQMDRMSKALDDQTLRASQAEKWRDAVIKEASTVIAREFPPFLLAYEKKWIDEGAYNEQLRRAALALGAVVVLVQDVKRATEREKALYTAGRRLLVETAHAQPHMDTCSALPRAEGGRCDCVFGEFHEVLLKGDQDG